MMLSGWAGRLPTSEASAEASAGLSESFALAYAAMNSQQEDAAWNYRGKKLARYGELDRAVVLALVELGRIEEANNLSLSLGVTNAEVEPN